MPKRSCAVFESRFSIIWRGLLFLRTCPTALSLLFCEATKRDMLSLSTWDAVTPPFRTRTFEDYTEACARCEFHVTLTSKAQHLSLRSVMKFDKRKKVARGLIKLAYGF